MRILSLRLLTATPLAKLKYFFHTVLALPILENRPDELTIVAGTTQLTFIKIASEQQRPFYHVAFNIPENKLLEARKWQKERTPLIPPDVVHDAGYPDDVIHFSHWNAHSVFFDDPAGNLLEYIARHDLNNRAPGPFTANDILCASEIGLVVDDVPATALELREVFGLDQYRQASQDFAAIGDEDGLFVVFKQGRILSPNQESVHKAARVFPTVVTIQGENPAQYTVPDFPYEIAMQ